MSRLGVSVVCGEIRKLSEWAAAVERAGFNLMGIGDSPSVYPETYVQSAVVAQSTERIRFGPRVTNPVTRHPVVTASAMSALQDLSGGRAVLGIGVGDSAVHTIGRRKATLAELREYITALRGLFSDGIATYRGDTVRFPYTKGDVAIYVSASGPRGLAMAGEIADGVIVGGGVGRELVATARAQIRAGAESAGRDPDAIDVWWLMGGSIAESRDAAVNAIRTHLAAAANATFRTGLKDRPVPAEFVAPLRALLHRYDFESHEVPGPDAPNARLVQELGLTEFLAERFTLAGTPDDVVEQLTRAAGWGADAIWMTMPLPDKLGFLQTMGERVIPRIRETAGVG